MAGDRVPSAACDGCGFKVCPVLGQPCCDQCSHDRQRSASAAAADHVTALRRLRARLDSRFLRPALTGELRWR